MADSPRKKARSSATKKAPGAASEDASDAAELAERRRRERREARNTRRETPLSKREGSAPFASKEKLKASESQPDEAAPAKEKAAEKAEKKAKSKASEKPSFAINFPSDPALDRLLVLFNQGNYAAVRQDAKALLASTEDAEVRSAVREIQRRLEPDSIAIAMVVMAALLLVILSGYYWTHTHETAPPASLAPSPASS